MRFKSDLKESTRITPEGRHKMHQTANNFNARQQSKGGAMDEDETLYAEDTTVAGP